MRFRQIQMGDEADVGLVDAHTESDGGAHHDAFLAQEAALVGGALRRRQAGVVGQGRGSPGPTSHSAVSSTFLRDRQ